jgi:hypothetical protein
MSNTINPACDLQALTEGLMQRIEDRIAGRTPELPMLTQEQGEAVYGCIVTAIMAALGPMYRLLPQEVTLRLFQECGAAIAHCAGIEPGQPDAPARTQALEVAGKQALLLYGMMEQSLRGE